MKEATNYKTIVTLKEAHSLNKAGVKTYIKNCLVCEALIASTNVEQICSETCETKHNIYLEKLEKYEKWISNGNYAKMRDYVEHNGKKLKVYTTNVNADLIAKNEPSIFWYNLIDEQEHIYLKDLTEPLKKIN